MQTRSYSPVTFFQPLIRLVSQAVILLFVLVSVAFAGLPKEIRTSIELLESAYSPSEKLMATVRYTNTADYEVRVLSWETVLNGRIDVDFLDIEYDGVPLAYTGRIYKRERINESHFVIFEPGETKAVNVDLESGYDINYEGVYEVYLKNQARVAKRNKTAPSFKLTKDRPIQFKRTPIVRSCSPSQDLEIDAALSAAEIITLRARNDLRNTPPTERVNARRFVEWFGVYSESRWNRVQTNFDRIYSAVSGQTLTFICDSTSTDFAYVYPDRPYEIFLGASFWAAPRNGTDSKAGTIVHELSHFNVIASTSDHVYGQRGARSLARSNPTRASSNADSHEYFAENTPFLLMPEPASIEVATPLISQKVVKNLSFELVSNISNTGSSALGSVTVIVRMTDDEGGNNPRQIGSDVLSGLEANQTVLASVRAKAPEIEGTYFVVVCADAVSQSGSLASDCSNPLPVIVEKGSVITPVIDLLLGD